MSSEPQIVLTDTTKSKCFRMLQDYSIHNIVKRAIDGRQTIYRKGPEYHVLSGDYVVVVVHGDDGSLVVVTQMHQHADYRSDTSYEKIESIPLRV